MGNQHTTLNVETNFHSGINHWARQPLGDRTDLFDNSRISNISAHPLRLYPP